MEVVWDRDATSHEKLIEKAGLKDDKLENRDFVRIEVTPTKITSKKRSDWKLKVDEEGTLPKWYSSAQKHCESVIWKAWEASLKETLWKLNLGAVNEVVEEIKKIKYLKFQGKLKADWNVSFGNNLSAARGAAWDAARDAARDAAGGAAGDAAWDAARDARLFAYIKLCASLKTKIDPKHIKHAEERMEVWRRGFGLKCDVNGKLFVYAVGKKEEFEVEARA